MTRLLFVFLLTLAFFAFGLWFATLGPRAQRSTDNYMQGIVDAHEYRVQFGADAPLRIVLVGGSSLGWSVSAKQMTETIGVPVLNLGTHAGLGYRTSYDIYADALDPARDVLLLSPEYELIRINERLTAPYCDYLFVTRQLDWTALKCGMRHFEAQLTDALQAAVGRTFPDDFYRRSGFNSFGDYVYHYDLPRQPVLGGGLNPLRLDEDAKVIARYAAFVDELMAEGFRILYVPVTMADSKCAMDNENYAELHRRLAGPAHYDFTVDYPYCLPDDVFFDSVYHMRRTAVVSKTERFSETVSNWLSDRTSSTAPNE